LVLEKVIIKPYVPEDLNYVSASVNTIRGLVSSSWRKEADALVLDVVLPVNSEGKICIPLTGFTNPIVKENGRVIYRNNKFVPGVRGLPPERGKKVLLLSTRGRETTRSDW